MLSAALVLALALPAEASADPVAWIHDDWATAKKRAIAEGKLVAVDVWATWCHTCLSMKNYTLREAPMKRVAATHTWLSLDYDQPANAAFFTQFPINAFPTFMVVDPAKETVVARWLGSGTADQMSAFFAGARKTAADANALGQRALAKGDFAGAIKIFEAALSKKPAATERTRLLSGYIEALWKGDPAQCAAKGLPYVDATDDTAPGIDFVAMVAYCAESTEGEAKTAIMKRVKARLEKTAANPALDLSADDTSSLYSALIDAHEALGEGDAAKLALTKRVTLLEAAAKAAPDIEARSTFDAHRLSCYLKLKRYADAEAMLAASAKAMPTDFNHPWRQAILELERGAPKAGLLAIERALKLGYGPRRLRLHATKIDLQMATKNYAGVEATLAAARDEIAKMDPKLVRQSWVAKLDRQEAALAAVASAH